MSVVFAVVVTVISAVSFTGTVVVTDMCTPWGARASGDVSHYTAKVGEIPSVLKIKICDRKAVYGYSFSRKS